MAGFMESPFAFAVPERLVGPDSSGGFYGAAVDVPTDGTWEVQTQAGSAGWIIADGGLPPKQWVRARPAPPAPLTVGEVVLVHGSYWATIVATDGLWYWVRHNENGSHVTVPHRDVAPVDPEQEPA